MDGNLRCRAIRRRHHHHDDSLAPASIGWDAMAEREPTTMLEGCIAAGRCVNPDVLQRVGVLTNSVLFPFSSRPPMA